MHVLLANIFIIDYFYDSFFNNFIQNNLIG